MGFQVGDQVVHWVYGPGEIIQLDEKQLSGHTKQYYVVQIRDLNLWVPVGESGESSLRFPTPASDFEKLYELLSSQGEPLPDDRMERKTLLTDQLKDGTLESVCRVVRDLTLHARTKKMNDNDRTIMERAKSFLLNEWRMALSIPDDQAERKMNELLGGELPTKPRR